MSEKGLEYFKKAKDELDNSIRYRDAGKMHSLMKKELDPILSIDKWFKIYEEKLLYYWIRNISDKEYLKWVNKPRKNQLEYAKVIWDVALENRELF